MTITTSHDYHENYEPQSPRELRVTFTTRIKTQINDFEGWGKEIAISTVDDGSIMFAMVVLNLKNSNESIEGFFPLIQAF